MAYDQNYSSEYTNDTINADEYFIEDNVFTAVVTGQEMIEEVKKNKGDGLEYNVPVLVLKCELKEKLKNPKRPYDDNGTEPIPDGIDRAVQTKVNFWPIDDETKARITAFQCEALKLPDEFEYADLALPDDGSAPNLNLAGREVWLRVTKFAGRQGDVITGWDLKHYNYDKPMVKKASPELLKQAKRAGGFSLAEKRAKLREERNAAVKKQTDALKALATVGADDFNDRF